jgi:cAMP-dependent protein kinase regulator
MNPGDKPTDVYNYKKPGEYFGELSLIKDAPRAASIICKTDATVVTLDRYSFKRLLGPIEEILKRN